MTDRTYFNLATAERILADRFGFNLITSADLNGIDGIPTVQTLRKYGMLSKVWEETYEVDGIDSNGDYFVATRIRYYYKLVPLEFIKG